MIRTIIRRSLAVGILAFAWWAASSITTNSPWAAPLAAIAAILLLILTRAMTIAQHRRG